MSCMIHDEELSGMQADALVGAGSATMIERLLDRYCSCFCSLLGRPVLSPHSHAMDCGYRLLLQRHLSRLRMLSA